MAANMQFGGEEIIARSRRPEIIADAAHVILTRPSREYTGNFFVDEQVLAAAGVTDFDQYAVTPGSDLIPDFFLDDSHFGPIANRR